MRDLRQLEATLARIDGRGYSGYHEIKGRWDFGDFVVTVDWVQGDPFAAPSRLRATLTPAAAGIPPALLGSQSRRIGVACHLARAFRSRGDAVSRSRGSGRSGVVTMASPGQEVLDQTAVRVLEDGSVEARFRVGLPARGRTILGEQAIQLLTSDLNGVIEGSLPAAAHAPDALVESAEVNEDADALRDALPGLGLVAFVADGSHLPRRSGIDDRPLEGDGVVPFVSPASLSVAVDLPNAGRVTGMGVPEGVTLIVGGGFHGKSTLLRALEVGVYNHRPGDGRERVVTIEAAAKIRAEDGRSVAGVDISPFIDDLPFGDDTTAFTTVNASGSTSQAASLVEAIEAGAGLVLVDEDTAATNFMIRDRRMQALVPSEVEPITPFVDRVRDLHDVVGASTVMVIGGSGDYLDVADLVIAMERYRPLDVTERAREVSEEHPTGRAPERGPPIRLFRPRRPRPDSIDPRRGRRAESLTVRDTRTLVIGTEEVDLSAVEQIVSWSQANAIGHALLLARRRFMDGERSLSEILRAVRALVEDEGLDALDELRTGDLAAFRSLDLAAALNRVRTLRVTHR